MFEQLISKASLKKHAGPAVFQRGEDYFTDGHVRDLRATHQAITAQVLGTEKYLVELSVDSDELSYDCTCPHAADGYFCKHCVAVGLAWLAMQAPQAKANGRTRQKKDDPWLDIKTYLSHQHTGALIELLLDVALRDERLYQSLSLKAARSGGGKHELNAFLRAIDGATQVDGFLDWHEAHAFASGIEPVVDELENLLNANSDTGTAAMLMALTEHTIERIEQALEHVDDSGGGIGEIAERLCELHYRACQKACPDPAQLAERLFWLETHLSFGLCDFSITTYRTALGKAGLQRYRELAEAAWNKLKPRDASVEYDSQRSRIAHIMEQLARDSGDVDALVAIKAQDLSYAYHYLAIAEILVEANQPDKALEWAERGLKAFPKRTDSRLRDFLVEAYLHNNRQDEALQLTWIQFEETPILQYYQKLHTVTAPLGLWPVQRERALSWISDAKQTAREKKSPHPWLPHPTDFNRSLRLAIALWEDDLDAAWKVSQAGVSDQKLLIKLAEKLETPRPEQAIHLYRSLVPNIVGLTNNTAYADAIRLIQRMGKLMHAQQQFHPFADYLANLRIQFKPKRNFIKLLDTLSAQQTN